MNEIILNNLFECFSLVFRVLVRIFRVPSTIGISTDNPLIFSEFKYRTSYSSTVLAVLPFYVRTRH